MNEPRRSTFATLDGFWMSLAVAAVGFLAAVVPLRSWDYWYHITVGRLLDIHHALPTRDIFSYTIGAEAPLMVQPWIGKFWLYRLHEFGGLPTVMVARNLCALAAIAIIAIAVYRLSSRNVRVTTGLTLLHGISFLAVGMNVSPQMFAWPLFTLLLGIALLVINRRINRWAMLLFLPGAVFWANLSPQFIVPALLATIFAAVSWKMERAVFVPTAIAAGGSVLALLATPYGPSIVEAMSDMTGTVAWVILGAPLLIAPLSSEFLQTPGRRVGRLVGSIAAALPIIVMIAIQPWTEAHRELPKLVFGETVRQKPPLEGFAPADTPVQLVEIIRLWGSQPRVLAESHLSGYILYEVQNPESAEPIVWPSPDHPPSPEVAKLRAQLVADAAVARGALQQYGIRAVIISGDLTPLGRHLDEAPEWEKIVTTENGTLYQRVRTKQKPPL